MSYLITGEDLPPWKRIKALIRPGLVDTLTEAADIIHDFNAELHSLGSRTAPDKFRTTGTIVANQLLGCGGRIQAVLKELCLQEGIPYPANKQALKEVQEYLQAHEESERGK